MLNRLTVTAAVICGLMSCCVGKERPTPLPIKTSELIKLIDADGGNDPDLGYRLLIGQVERFGKDKERYEQEVTDKNFQAVVDRLAPS